MQQYTIQNKVAMQDEKIRKGPWLEEEDELLAAAVAVLGERRWDALAKSSGLRRSGKSCRLRWMNYLRPNLKHGGITAEEERVIIELHEKWGNKWAKIAQRLPGRTDNEIKNYWRSYLKKKTLVHDKDFSMSASGNATQISESGTTSPCSINDEQHLALKDEALGYAGHSSDAFEQLSLTCSPYETRMTEWMAMDPEDQFWNFDIFDSERISHDNGSNIWDYSLWDR